MPAGCTRQPALHKFCLLHLFCAVHVLCHAESTGISKMTDRSCFQELAAGKCVSKLKCSQRHAATAGSRPGNVSNSGMRLKTRTPCSHHGGPVTATPHEHDCPIHFQLAIPKSPATSNTQHQGLDAREMFDILIRALCEMRQSAQNFLQMRHLGSQTACFASV